jgi:hypothetical protein
MNASFEPRFSSMPMPVNGAIRVIDEMTAAARPRDVFDVVRAVETWPDHLGHYRYVRFREKSRDGGGLVEMSANRPFGIANWPTWWLSEMTVNHDALTVRFRHTGGITTGMDVEWSVRAVSGGTHIRLVHVWNGPRWPLIGRFAAVTVIGPVFVHGIASRTMTGLARVAETRTARINA